MSWENTLKKQEQENRDNGPTGQQLLDKRPNRQQIFNGLLDSGYVTAQKNGRDQSKDEIRDWSMVSLRLDGEEDSITFSSPYYFGLLTAFYNGWLKEQNEPELTELSEITMSASNVEEFVMYVKKYHRNGHFYSSV